jgi:hypothetical protein
MTLLTFVLLSLLGSVIGALVGTIWYSNATPMGKIHLQFLGFDKLSAAEQKRKMEKGKSMMPKMYASQLILSFLTSGATVFIVSQSIQNGLAFSMALGFVIFNWLCFIVPMIGQGILWGNCDPKLAWKKFFSDAGSNLVTLVLIALMAKLFVA